MERDYQSGVDPVEMGDLFGEPQGGYALVYSEIEFNGDIYEFEQYELAEDSLTLRYKGEYSFIITPEKRFFIFSWGEIYQFHIPDNLRGPYVRCHCRGPRYS